MNTLLIYFALPVATIVLAFVLEKILRCPFLTAATFFAIYLIVAFAAFDTTFLVWVIVYTILAFIAAALAEIFYKKGGCGCYKTDNTNSDRPNLTARITGLSTVPNSTNNNNGNCSCNNVNTTPNVASVNVRDNTNGNQSCWCCYRR